MDAPAPPLPAWLDPAPWLPAARGAPAGAVRAALAADEPGPADFAALLSPEAGTQLETLAQKARALTRRHFGRTISLYVPLYLSDHCPGGCLYCGFAADRRRPRRLLEPPEMAAEMDALRRMGFDEILLLTGDRTSEAGFDYLRGAVAAAAARFHLVTIETFPMSEAEYRDLAQAGCTGLTLYQETYDPGVYAQMHRWGPKQDYLHRLETPGRALAGGLRTAGLGILLGLADPVADALALFRHLEHLRKAFWQAGLSVSFPRIRPQAGGFKPPFPVADRFLAQMIFAFRICCPDLPLTLSTRESPAFRDGIAGLGINRMSIASRTTVGGYQGESAPENGQFSVSDGRTVAEFCAALRARELEPIFKNWDSAYRPG